MLSTVLPALVIQTFFSTSPSSLPVAGDAPGKDCVLFLSDNYTRAWSDAKDRNVPVLIMSWDGWAGESDSSIDTFYSDRAFLKAADRAVVIICSQYKFGETTQRVRGETRTVCGQFGCFPPGTPQRMMNPVFLDFAEAGTLKTPLYIVATPDKEVVDRFVEETRPSAVTSALARAHRKLGKGLGHAESYELMNALQIARRASETKEWRAANKALAAVAAIPGESSLHHKLASLRKTVEAAGEALHKEAEARWTRGEHLAGLQALDELAFFFDGTPLARKVSAQLQGLLKSPEGKPHARAVAREASARRLYHQGADQEAAGEYKKALSTLKKLTRSHGETLWAEMASSLISNCEEALKRR